jgi:sugar/nucleoside kinase (ribokinase family)
VTVVVVVGDVMNDTIVRPLAPLERGSDTNSEIAHSPGGSGANQAAWLASLGVAVRFYGRVGASDAQAHASALRAVGVDARIGVDDEVATGNIVVFVTSNGERNMFTDRGANRRLSAADLPHGLDDVSHLHVSGYALFEPSARQAVGDLIDEAVARSVPVSIDPSSVSYLQAMGPELFFSATEGAGLIFPNAPEAALLSGCPDEGKAARSLTDHYPTVVVKLGRRGAILAERGAPPVLVDAPGATTVDTTGAGDAFFAGYLAAALRGEPPVAAVRAALQTAALAVGRLGGRPRSTQR